MPKVTCCVTEVNLYHSLPVLEEDLKIAGVSISDYFRQASLLSSGVNAIELSIDWSLKDIIPASPDYGIDDGKLQDTLELLLKLAPPNGATPVGLILANFYSQAGSAYGYMFDLDFHTSSVGPRQGCALFLNQIHNATGDDDQAFRNRVVYTAIHEIGHVFNLWHVDNPASFMKPPPNDDLLHACTFVPDHKRYLQLAADPTVASFVLPGQSASSFGIRVPGQDYPSGDDSYYLPVGTDGIMLKIGLSHHHFWHFEPVELDVEVSVPDAGTGTVVIPDEIDPGYVRLEIWITRPDGERHRYRPSRRFCSNPKTLEISKDKPFRRDISIMKQSGGYTFPMVGKYQVQAILRLSPGEPVVSNVVECEVLRAQPESDTFAAIHGALSSLEAAKFFSYRSRIPARPTLTRLRRFAEDHHASTSAAAVHYSLGRVFLKAAEVTGNIDQYRDLRNHGLRHLSKVVDHPMLGPHRKAIANQLLGNFRTDREFARDG